MTTLPEVNRWQGALGLVTLMGILWVLSERRAAIRARVVIWGVVLQFALGWLVLHSPRFFQWADEAVRGILSFTTQGAAFVFGGLATGSLATTSGAGPGAGFFFAFQVLPTIIFFSSLMSILYHLGVMQRFVQAVAWVMNVTMGVSGAESLSVAANTLVGQTEAPLVIKPYIPTMTRSELMALMTGGFATIAGGVMMAYVQMGVSAGHLLTASFMSAPAAFVMAKILVPETEESRTAGSVRIQIERTSANLVDAAASGAADGLKLALNVAAMLLAFIALVGLLNGGLALVDGLLGRSLVGDTATGVWWFPSSLKEIFGFVLAPVAWTLGAPWGDQSRELANLLGTKLSINEFVAYTLLAEARAALHPQVFVIASYALCGFANFASIAIQLGGIGSLAPERRADLARLGMRAMFAGAFASWQTAAIAGLLTTPTEEEWLRHYAARVEVRAAAMGPEAATAELEAVREDYARRFPAPPADPGQTVRELRGRVLAPGATGGGGGGGD